MKKSWIGFGTLALFVLSISWISQGCKGTLPAIPAIVPTPFPSGVISNFGNGSLNMNQTLENGDGGYFTAETYGGAAGHANMIDGSNNPNILYPNPGDGSAYAVHIYGAITDTTPTGYPDMALYGFLKNNPSNLPNSEWYDLNFAGAPVTFTKIRFDMNIGADDTNTQKLFAIGSALEVPSTTAPGGTCPPNFSNNCFDYWWSNYGSGNSFTNTTYPTGAGIKGHGWQPVTIAINTLNSNGGFGMSTGIITSNPAYKQQALFLIWKFSDNGAGNSYTDFWVDNVQFAP
jgi:hypothetical protein